METSYVVLLRLNHPLYLHEKPSPSTTQHNIPRELQEGIQHLINLSWPQLIYMYSKESLEPVFSRKIKIKSRLAPEACLVIHPQSDSKTDSK